MQLNFVDESQLAELLEDADVLDIVDHGAQRVYVLTYTGADVLAFVDPVSGGASVVYPCKQFDDESGGSIHEHARYALREAL